MMNFINYIFNLNYHFVKNVCIVSKCELLIEMLCFFIKNINMCIVYLKKN